MRYVFSVCMCLLISASAINAQTGYTIKDLGTLGGTTSSGFAINASGQVTGSAQTANGDTHAFLYDGTTMTDLGTLGGSIASVGRGVNASGQVSGYAAFSNTDHAFLYSGGVMTDLGTLGGIQSEAYGINDSGQVTGTYGFSNPFGIIQHAFLYSSGVMTDLGTLGGLNSGGWGINAAGQVTGGSGTATTNPDFTHAFLYSSGTMTDLGTLGTTHSSGYGINAAGQVTGSSFPIGSPFEHAFLYSNGAMTDLGTLGGQRSYGFSINGAGQVTGQSSVTDNKYGCVCHAFLYTPGQGMVDLNSLLPSGSGWTLLAGWGINDLGQVTGEGVINGQNHAWLLTPPLSQQLTNLVNALPAPLNTLLLPYIPNITTAISSLTTKQKTSDVANLQTLKSLLPALGLPSSEVTSLTNLANALISALSA